MLKPTRMVGKAWVEGDTQLPGSQIVPCLNCQRATVFAVTALRRIRSGELEPWCLPCAATDARQHPGKVFFTRPSSAQIAEDIGLTPRN